MAVEGYGAQVWLPDFMPAVKQQIVDTVQGLTSDRVFRSLFPDADHLRFPPADRFVTLFNPNFPVDQTMVTGGGTYNTAFDSTLLTTVFIRVDADIENRSTKQLDDEAAGVDEFLLQLITGLQMWNGPAVADADGVERYAFRRPMRIAPGFRVERKPGGGDTRWAVAPVSWELSFVANLGNNYPIN